MLTAEHDSNYLSCWMFCAMRRVSQAGTRGGFQRDTRLNRTPAMMPSSVGSVVLTSERHHDADHSDFWRIKPDGLAFLLRGYRR